MALTQQIHSWQKNLDMNLLSLESRREIFKKYCEEFK